MKKLINTGAAVCAVVCLVVTFLAAGFAVCAATPLPTRALSQAYATDGISPYTHDELVKAAVAIYDYSFANHNADALNATMDELVAAAQADGRAPSNAQGEEYRLDGAAISHLDDCYALASAARVPLIAIGVLAVAAAAHVGVRTGRKNLGRVLVCAGGLAIAAFLAFGATALIDFDAFFSLFHGLLFASGTWTFWYRSLLICSLPEGFWMGMGILWFATSLLLSILSCCVGVHLIRKCGARPQTTDIQSTRFNR